MPSSFPTELYIPNPVDCRSRLDSFLVPFGVKMAKDDDQLESLGRAIQTRMAQWFQTTSPLEVYQKHERAPRKALLILLGANRQSEESVRLLSIRSKVPDAMVLVRTMYERLFNMKYIMRDSKNREALANRFLDSKVLGSKRRLDLSKRVDGPAHLRVHVSEDHDQIEESYSRFCQTYGISGKSVPQYWHGSTVTDIAKSIGEEHRFRTFGGMFSEFVHLEGIAKQGIGVENPMSLVAGTDWPGFAPMPCGYARDILLDSWIEYATEYQPDALNEIHSLKDLSIGISSTIAEDNLHPADNTGVNQ